MKLKRTDWKYLVDTLMFLCMLGLVATGLLMAFVIPEGRLALGQSKYFLGLHRHQWGAVHLDLSLAFTAFAVIHVVLSWSWIKGKAVGLFGKAWKLAVGLTVLAAAVVPLLFWAAFSKNDPGYADLGMGRGRESMQVRTSDPSVPEPPASDGPPAPAAGAVEPRGEAAADQDDHKNRAVAGRMETATAEVVITGQMTFREVERATGIPAGDIMARLGLPAGVSLDETIGRLRRAYGFEMAAVREAVAGLLESRRRLPAG